MESRSNQDGSCQQLQQELPLLLRSLETDTTSSAAGQVRNVAGIGRHSFTALLLLHFNPSPIPTDSPAWLSNLLNSPIWILPTM